MDMYEPERMNDMGLPGDVGLPKSEWMGERRKQVSNVGEVYNEEMPQGGEQYVGGAVRANEEEIQFKLDGARILDSLQHSLLGEVWDITEGKWKRISRPLLSVDGVGKVVQIISFSVANVDHRLTKLGIDSINFSMIETRNNLRRQLMLDPLFRIHQNAPLSVYDIKVILEEVCECKESLLKRSLDGFTVHQTGHVESHTYNHQDDYKNNGGMIGKLFK